MQTASASTAETKTFKRSPSSDEHLRRYVTSSVMLAQIETDVLSMFVDETRMDLLEPGDLERLRTICSPSLGVQFFLGFDWFLTRMIYKAPHISDYQKQRLTSKLKSHPGDLLTLSKFIGHSFLSTSGLFDEYETSGDINLAILEAVQSFLLGIKVGDFRTIVDPQRAKTIAMSFLFMMQKFTSIGLCFSAPYFVHNARVISKLFAGDAVIQSVVAHSDRAARLRVCEALSVYELKTRSGEFHFRVCKGGTLIKMFPRFQDAQEKYVCRYDFEPPHALDLLRASHLADAFFVTLWQIATQRDDRHRERICAGCAKNIKYAPRRYRCGGCRTTKHCSRACFVRNWPQHRADCHYFRSLAEIDSDLVTRDSLRDMVAVHPQHNGYTPVFNMQQHCFETEAHGNPFYCIILSPL
jgi:hypothetical protein